MLTKDINRLRALNVPDDVHIKFMQRLRERKFTRDENPISHFCVYFAAYDPEAKLVFIGLHKKSGFWLFNGGHIDKGEDSKTAVYREICEEWGLKPTAVRVFHPELITITDIDNPAKQTCRVHYDIWYFIEMNKDEAHFDQDCLDTEFSEHGWYGLGDAYELVENHATIEALEYIDEHLFTN